MFIYCYCPQTKFAKVMFLQVSVILFTGGHAWLLRGGMCGCSGGHVWLLWGGMCGCSQGGVCGHSGGACVVALGGACMVAPGGHV